jgi:hypothetical protein
MIKFYTHGIGEIRLLMSESGTCIMVSIFTVTSNIHQCTYLNSSLLVAPRKYVLHCLDPGMY